MKIFGVDVELDIYLTLTISTCKEVRTGDLEDEIYS